MRVPLRLLAAVVAALPACARPDPDSPPIAPAPAPRAATAARADAAAPGAVDRRSIVLVTIDTLRADHLGCYGYPRATSPRIDEVARRALVFERASTQWPTTGPSMASLITSTYGSTSGVMRWTMEQKVPRSYDLLTELLHEAGWQTLGVVANFSLAPKFQFDQGFDRFVVVDGAPADRVSAAARELMDARDPGRPYFLWVHYLDPHAPYKPPPGFAEEFDGDALYAADERPPVPIDPAAEDASAQKTPGASIGRIPAYAYLPGKDRVRDYVVRYDGDVRFLDHELGALLDWLREHADLDQAILVVTSDHGEGLGEQNYYFEHGRFPYENCAHVPLLLVHPAWEPARIAAPVGLIDVAPTLLEAVGLEPGWQFEGSSLLPWLRDGAREPDARPVFTESGFTQAYDVSIRRGRHKLIRIGTRHISRLLTGRPYELYDLVADPGETRNLVDELPDAFESLRAELDAFVETAYARKPPTDSEAAALSDEERRILIQQGYAHDKEHGAEGDRDHERDLGADRRGGG